MSAPTRPRQARGAGVAALTLLLTGALPVVAPTPVLPTLVSRAHAAPTWSPSMCQSFTPSDPRQGNPSGNAWHVARLQYAKLDEIGADGSGVRIAVIDTGADPTTSALYEGSRISTENFAPIAENDSVQNSRGQVVALDCRHGSFVLSLLAARGGIDDRTDFRGIAPGAEVIVMRGLEGATPVARQSDQDESLAPTIAAVNAAVDQGVDIISISQRGDDTADYRAAIARAVDAGILVVAAAGNRGPDGGDSFPASYPGVMAVGMTTLTDAADPQSQSGPGMTISVSAPGSQLTAALPMCVTGVDPDCPRTSADRGAYQVDTGTSFATPLVSGAAALVMQRFPDLTAAQVRQRLEQTADPTGAAAPDRLLGHGIVNPYRALVAPFAPAAASATPAPAAPSRYAPPAPPDNAREQTMALAVAGTALGVVGIAAVVVAAVPSGRLRRWRPASRDR